MGMVKTKWRPQLEVNEWYYGLATDWRRVLRASKSPKEASRAIIKQNAAEMKPLPAGPKAIFWLMLAYYQKKDGCLQPTVLRRALAAIDRGAAAYEWLDTRASTPARRQRDFELLRVFLLEQN